MELLISNTPQGISTTTTGQTEKQWLARPYDSVPYLLARSSLNSMRGLNMPFAGTSLFSLVRNIDCVRGAR